MLPLPNFVAEHLRAHESHPLAIVRGGAINVESFDDLPPPVWRMKDYSGNYFWTTNVSVPLATIRAIGGFDETFAEYGWEDIDVGLRLRFAGVKAVFNRNALVYHYKPRPRSGSVEKMMRQAQAQARTAVQLAPIHPHWRTHLATGDQRRAALTSQMAAGRAISRGAIARRVGDLSGDRRAFKRANCARHAALPAEAYFEELERTSRRRAHERFYCREPTASAICMLSTPAIATVRASFPDAHVTMVVSPYNRVVMERNPDVDELVDLPREVRPGTFGRTHRGYDAGDRARAARGRLAARSARRDAGCGWATPTSAAGWRV